MTSVTENGFVLHSQDDKDVLSSNHVGLLHILNENVLQMSLESAKVTANSVSFIVLPDFSTPLSYLSFQRVYGTLKY